MTIGQKVDKIRKKIRCFFHSKIIVHENKFLLELYFDYWQRNSTTKLSLSKKKLQHVGGRGSKCCKKNWWRHLWTVVPNLSELLEAMMPTMASARVNLPRDNSHLTDSGTILKVKIQFKIRA